MVQLKTNSAKSIRVGSNPWGAVFDMRALPTVAAALTELSERDQAILRDVADGLSPKEIAECIDIPEDELYRSHRLGLGGDPASAQRRHDARGLRAPRKPPRQPVRHEGVRAALRAVPAARQ